MHDHFPTHQPPTTGYAVPAGVLVSEAARQNLEDRLQQVLSREHHEERLRAALRALHAYRTGDLTQGERNALLGRVKEHAQAGGSPMAWVRVQDLLIEDVLSAAEAAGWVA